MPPSFLSFSLVKRCFSLERCPERQSSSSGLVWVAMELPSFTDYNVSKVAREFCGSANQPVRGLVRAIPSKVEKVLEKEKGRHARTVTHQSPELLWPEMSFAESRTCCCAPTGATDSS
jgi:hypothetical protein